MVPSGRIPHSPRFQLDFLAFSELRKILSCCSGQKTSQSRFACHLAIYLPEVAALIDEDDFGVIHLEVGVLAQATISAIAKNDLATVQRHFAFISDTLNSLGKELQDAIEVSYIQYVLLYTRISSDMPIHETLNITLDGLKKHFGPS
jgi:hypothetical protein